MVYEKYKSRSKIQIPTQGPLWALGVFGNQIKKIKKYRYIDTINATLKEVVFAKNNCERPR